MQEPVKASKASRVMAQIDAELEGMDDVDDGDDDDLDIKALNLSLSASHAASDGQGSRAREIQPTRHKDHTYEVINGEAVARVFDTKELRGAFLHFCNSSIKVAEMHLVHEGPYMSAAQFVAMCRELRLVEPEGGLPLLMLGIVYAHSKGDDEGEEGCGEAGLGFSGFLDVLLSLAFEAQTNVAGVLQKRWEPRMAAESAGVASPVYRRSASVSGAQASLEAAAAVGEEAAGLCSHDGSASPTAHLKALPPAKSTGDKPTRFARVEGLSQHTAQDRVLSAGRIQSLASSRATSVVNSAAVSRAMSRISSMRNSESGILQPAADAQQSQLSPHFLAMSLQDALAQRWDTGGEAPPSPLDSRRAAAEAPPSPKQGGGKALLPFSASIARSSRTLSCNGAPGSPLGRTGSFARDLIDRGFGSSDESNSDGEREDRDAEAVLRSPSKPAAPPSVPGGSPLRTNVSNSKAGGVHLAGGVSGRGQEPMRQSAPAVVVTEPLEPPPPPPKPVAIHRVSKALGTTEEGSLVITGQVRKSPATSNASGASGAAAAAAAVAAATAPAPLVPHPPAAPPAEAPASSMDNLKVTEAGPWPIAPPPEPSSPTDLAGRRSKSPEKPGRALTPYELQLAKLQAKYNKHNAAVAAAEAGGPEVILPLYREKPREKAPIAGAWKPAGKASIREREARMSVSGSDAFGEGDRRVSFSGGERNSPTRRVSYAGGGSQKGSSGSGANSPKLADARTNSGREAKASRMAKTGNTVDALKAEDSGTGRSLTSSPSGAERSAMNAAAALKSMLALGSDGGEEGQGRTSSSGAAAPARRGMMIDPDKMALMASFGAGLGAPVPPDEDEKAEDAAAAAAGQQPADAGAADDPKFAFVMKKRAEMEAKLAMIEQKLGSSPQPRPPPGAPTPGSPLTAIRTSVPGSTASPLRMSAAGASKA